jgi:hypothetical protein
VSATLSPLTPLAASLLAACANTAAPLPDAAASSCQQREPAALAAEVCPAVSATPLDPQAVGSRLDPGIYGLASLRQDLREHHQSRPGPTSGSEWAP